jgi:N-acetylglucosamine-6-phosphate deacetylase
VASRKPFAIFASLRETAFLLYAESLALDIRASPKGKNRFSKRGIQAMLSASRRLARVSRPGDHDCFAKADPEILRRAAQDGTQLLPVNWLSRRRLRRQLTQGLLRRFEGPADRIGVEPRAGCRLLGLVANLARTTRDSLDGMEITANIAGHGLSQIQVHGRQIAAVRPLGPIRPQERFVNPGFVDIQINGFAGVDFSAPDLDPATAVSILPFLWKAGVTTFCPTLITNSIPQLQENFRTLEAARRLDRRFAEAVPCYHLEGPYLSPGGARGAHDPSRMKSPDWEEFSSLQQAAGGRIGIVTLAPELPGAFDFIRRASAAGVVVALGHTDAAPEHIHQAVLAGAKLSTHLGNGCPNLLHRHQNPLWAQLAEDQLQVSLICDGFHLPPDLVRVAYRVKGIERCILITDAVHVAGLAPGRYSMVGRGIELLPSGQVVTDDRQSMAGSALTMNRAVAVFEKFAQATLAEALQAASANPARLIARQGVTTQIEPGQPAELVVFRPDDGALRVEAVLFKGDRLDLSP